MSRTRNFRFQTSIVRIQRFRRLPGAVASTTPVNGKTIVLVDKRTGPGA